MGMKDGYQLVDLTKKYGHESRIVKHFKDKGAALNAAFISKGWFETAGDMLCFRDQIQKAGFEWGKDFYMKKHGNPL